MIALPFPAAVSVAVVPEACTATLAEFEDQVRAAVMACPRWSTTKAVTDWIAPIASNETLVIDGTIAVGMLLGVVTQPPRRRAEAILATIRVKIDRAIGTSGSARGRGVSPEKACRDGPPGVSRLQ